MCRFAFFESVRQKLFFIVEQVSKLVSVSVLAIVVVGIFFVQAHYLQVICRGLSDACQRLLTCVPDCSN